MRRLKWPLSTRREFLVQSSATGVALTKALSGGGFAGLTESQPLPEGAASSQELTGLKEAFFNPPDSTRPKTRWWWFGGAVTPEEITRELTLMRDAGIGGVELQPVYPLEVDDPQRGIRNTPYFSAEWFGLLRHAVGEARRLGLQFDLTLGSGWPYGGPFIPLRFAARKLQLIDKDVKGPSDFFWDPGPLLPAGGVLVAALLIPVLPSEELDISQTKVMTSNPTVWKVPPGRWKIMIVLDAPTLMQVKRPTVGMEGYVLDHFNREALDLLLDAVGNRTLEELKANGLPALHSIFCDSIEVEGADWTPDFIKEFRQRRGYDITPYLPALWELAGPMTPHLRYDYHQTLSELMASNFFSPLADWAEGNGLTARIQAHGAMADVMQGYSKAHIPEGEHIQGGDQYSVDIAHRRLASSAGHIYQKPIISAETYTWLRHPVFAATLEMMKAATDAQFLDGINQIVNHGYPYSPPQVGEPGWTFYASCVINHNNTWWPHYPRLTQYIRRVSSVLQQGVSVNRVAVYLPLADVFAKFGAGGLHMDERLGEQLGTDLVLELRQSGYDFDFINDDALTKAGKSEESGLHIGTGVYSVVIVPGVQYMPPESLDRLAEFVRHGGILIFMGRVPAAAPGLEAQETRTERMKRTLNHLIETRSADKDAGSTKGKVMRGLNWTEAVSILKADLVPDFKILEAGDRTETALKRAIESVGFVHRVKGAIDFYFVSNVSASGQEFRAQFGAGHRVPKRWNPETGTTAETLVYEYRTSEQTKASVTEVAISLAPFESCFIVFTDSQENPVITSTDWPGPLQINASDAGVRVSGAVPRNGTYVLTTGGGREHRFTVGNVPSPISIAGLWHLKLGTGPILVLSSLHSWSELAEGKTFSGKGTYETDFEMGTLDKGIDWILDLGSVLETAEATLNGVSLGAAWKGWRRLACGDALKVGRNHLKIEVANLWINYVRSLPKPDLRPVAETYGIRWGIDEEGESAEPPPSGLLGPVRLIPLRRHIESF